MIDVLDQDFIRTARAKGLPEHRVVPKHALRAGLHAACRTPGVVRITAGNYGGKLGPFHFHLRELV